MFSRSGSLESDAATVRSLVLERRRHVEEKRVSMESRVSQQLQDLNEIVKTRTTGQSSNEIRCFSSAVVQEYCIKTISSSDKKKEIKRLMKEFDIVFMVKRTKTELERRFIEIISKQLKAHKDKGLQGSEQALLATMYAIPPKNGKVQLR